MLLSVLVQVFITCWSLLLGGWPNHRTSDVGSQQAGHQVASATLIQHPLWKEVPNGFPAWIYWLPWERTGFCTSSTLPTCTSTIPLTSCSSRAHPLLDVLWPWSLPLAVPWLRPLPLVVLHHAISYQLTLTTPSSTNSPLTTPSTTSYPLSTPSTTSCPSSTTSANSSTFTASICIPGNQKKRTVLHWWSFALSW